MKRFRKGNFLDVYTDSISSIGIQKEEINRKEKRMEGRKKRESGSVIGKEESGKEEKGKKEE